MRCLSVCARCRLASGGFIRPLLGGYYALPIHITVITTILRHTAETSIVCGVAYMCYSDWWRREDVTGLCRHMCVMTGNILFPVYSSFISSHTYVPTYRAILPLVALWNAWVCSSVVCHFFIHHWLVCAFGLISYLRDLVGVKGVYTLR